jgi:hypothetical protein
MYIWGLFILRRDDLHHEIRTCSIGWVGNLAGISADPDSCSSFSFIGETGYRKALRPVMIF